MGISSGQPPFYVEGEQYDVNKTRYYKIWDYEIIIKFGI
jgi:hypothetical protein